MMEKSKTAKTSNILTSILYKMEMSLLKTAYSNVFRNNFFEIRENDRE